MYSTATPLWRNGPPEKPVLCNACGSRWRTKGTLTNYTPLHARAEPTDSENYRKVCVVKPIIIKTKEKKLQKRKLLNDNAELSGEAPIFDQNFRRVYEEDTNNRSSSGSATSYSESCVHVGSTDASDLTGLDLTFRISCVRFLSHFHSSTCFLLRMPQLSYYIHVFRCRVLGE